MGHSVHNNTEHFLWSQVGKWAIMGQKLIYYHIGTPTYMLNDVSKHPRPLKIMLNHIFKNQCHKPRNKKNTFLVSKVGWNSKKCFPKPHFVPIMMFLANPYDFQQFNMPEIHFFILYQHSEIVEKTLSLLFPHRQKSAILIKY